jgi:agmatine deiminase
VDKLFWLVKCTFFVQNTDYAHLFAIWSPFHTLHRKKKMDILSHSRRLPAEWEVQDAVQLTLPHPGTDWAERLNDVMPCFLNIINTISKHQMVILVGDAEWIRQEGLEFEQPDRIIFANLPTNDTWARDHSGITIALQNGKFELLDFIFNGWGLKFPADKDNLITAGLDQLAFFEAKHRHAGMVLEGGGIESDGQGTLLTTAECLLSPNRNPHLSKKEVEQRLKSLFGVDRILWIEHGYLAGDDTDSHIDTLARFCTPDTICYVQCTDSSDEHFGALKKMEDELKSFRKADGKPYNLVPLPMSDAIYDEEGNRLPATYANFLFINGAILLPIYQVPQDAEAIAIFENLFPNHQIYPIDCRPLIYQHGSLHCVTMQYPKGSVNRLLME